MKSHKYLKYLRDSNPSKVWVREMFRTSLRLLSEDLIIVHFDMVSAQSFTADMVSSLLQDHILDDEMQEHLEKYPVLKTDCYEVYETVAGALNDKMRIIGGDIMGHAEATFHILDAISSKDYDSAHTLTISLAATLLKYEPNASKVWGAWVAKILEIVKQ